MVVSYAFVIVILHGHMKGGGGMNGDVGIQNAIVHGSGRAYISQKNMANKAKRWKGCRR